MSVSPENLAHYTFCVGPDVYPREIPESVVLPSAAPAPTTQSTCRPGDCDTCCADTASISKIGCRLNGVGSKKTDKDAEKSGEGLDVSHYKICLTKFSRFLVKIPLKLLIN